MKITVGRLKQIINEEYEEFKVFLTEKHKIPYFYKQESPKEELGDDAYAESAEQTDIILGDLKQILEDWAESAPEDSDEELYRVYHQDIQKLVDKYEGKEEHDCEEHPDQTHEEWEAEQGKEEGEKEPPKQKKKSKGKEKKEKSKKPKKSSKSGAKNFPYESKQLEQAVFQKLITALGGKE